MIFVFFRFWLGGCLTRVDVSHNSMPPPPVAKHNSDV